MGRRELGSGSVLAGWTPCPEGCVIRDIQPPEPHSRPQWKEGDDSSPLAAWGEQDGAVDTWGPSVSVSLPCCGPPSKPISTLDCLL